MRDCYQSPPCRVGIVSVAKTDKSDTPLIRYAQIPNEQKNGYCHEGCEAGSKEAAPRPQVIGEQGVKRRYQKGGQYLADSKDGRSRNGSRDLPFKGRFRNTVNFLKAFPQCSSRDTTH